VIHFLIGNPTTYHYNCFVDFEFKSQQTSIEKLYKTIFGSLLTTFWGGYIIGKNWLEHGAQRMNIPLPKIVKEAMPA